MRIQAPDADEQLRNALTGLAQRDPRINQVLGPCLAVPLNARLLKIEVARALHTVGDPEISAAIQRILLDYEARATEQTLAHLEDAEKSNAWRPYAVIPMVHSLLDVEPSNTSAWFDLGQAHGTLHQNRAEMPAYSEDLQIDPREREASESLQRSALELNPQFLANMLLFRERGRNGLASIDRYRYTVGARVPWGNENEFVEVDYSRVAYRPLDDRTLDGNILTARGQGNCIPTLLLYGTANLEMYTDRIRDRVTFDTGVLYDATPQLRLRTSGFLENVVENGESMRQDIHRGGARRGADYRFDRYWLLSGTYTYARYSDRNDYNDFYVVSEHTICFPPTQLKLILSGDFYGYSQQTVFPPPGQGLVGTIHPYFSPSFFAFYQARLDWTHWLSRDYFVHADQCWYSAQVGAAVDNQSKAYAILHGVLNYDVCPWLSIGLDGQVMLSDVYNYESLYAYVVFRSPRSLWR
jgi:hypothetical protein